MAAADLDGLKDRVCAEVDRWADRLIEASHRIHARPELCFEEHFAAGLLCDLLEDGGLVPQRGGHGLETGFVAEAGSHGPAVGICCEFDALPGIGHACGHNVIAAAGLGAALAAAAVAGDAPGRLRVLGTPAEEGGGGKIHMAAAGAFDGLDAALMVHPAGAELAGMDVIAVRQVVVDYDGRSAHAAAAPQEGRNALDAAVLGYMGVAALRQHIAERERVHGVITEGGQAPNVVPDHAQAHWYIRSTDLDALAALEERVMAALEGGAAAAGCTMTPSWPAATYAGMRHNQPLVDAYAHNAGRVGRDVRPLDDPDAPRVSGSTDMANVSHLVPSIHPMIAVAPTRVALHTPEMASHAAGPQGDQAVIDGAKVLAMTAVDVWCDADLRAEVAAAFDAAGGRAAEVPGL